MTIEVSPDLMTITAVPASDGWGFVGVVKIGEWELYRTLDMRPTPGEAQEWAAELFGDVLGSFLAAREWQKLKDRDGRIPRRTDLSFGLRGRPKDGGAA